MSGEVVADYPNEIDTNQTSDRVTKYFGHGDGHGDGHDCCCYCFYYDYANQFY